MTLRLILGRAGSGKTEYCLNSIRKELRERPDGHSIILLIPEQATFQLEKELAATPNLKKLIRIQILNFKILNTCYYMLRILSSLIVFNEK